MNAVSLHDAAMDVTHILDGLNDAQRDAVTAPSGSMLVLAGAGSGKTRVLTHRIAWQIQTQNMSPYSVLAVTFTNKAAAEMRSRIERLLAMPVRGMWVGTFHGIAHRLLRTHFQEAGLPQNFQILDADDQLRLVKRVINSLDLDEKKWPARQAVWFINAQKDEGRRPQHIPDEGDLYVRTHVSIYEAYELALSRGGMIDFAEMLLRAHELWREHPELLRHYQDRFHSLLVDEFQDTNTIQYAWVRQLAGDKNNLAVVGDDDQSIYGWRGARIENLQRFTTDFPKAQTVRLEQNYRSTGSILKAANGVIAQNAGRLGKELWTDAGDGEPIYDYAAFNEIDEARYVVSRIRDWVSQGNNHRECAVLYRSNAQSRVLEEAMLRAQMPYRIYGGQRFFERAEIRSAIAYMRLISRRDADSAFERVVNTPSRGIGDRTLEQIRSVARKQNVSLWRAAEWMASNTEIPGRTRNAIIRFIELINDMDMATINAELPVLTELVIDRSGLIDYYERERGERGQARVENLRELITAADTFDPDDEVTFDATLREGDTSETLLDEFLTHAALEAGDRQGDPNADCVQMMTLHSAKGLEFPVVFLTGLEDGLFPSLMSMEEPGRLEEERRLCYVGITRAMRQLYLTHAESRRINGQESYNRPSRFVQEIPQDLITPVRLSRSAPAPVSGPSRQTSSIATENESGYTLGQRVRHDKFGEGVVLNYEGQGSQARVQVNFNSGGSKWLMLSYAKLEVV